METRSLSMNKRIAKYTLLSDRNYNDNINSERLNETWQLNHIKISERLKKSKSPNRNFFLPSSQIVVSPITQQMPIIKMKQQSSGINRKKIDQLEAELDDQEMKYKVSDTPKMLEKLFFSYYNYLEGIIQCVPSGYTPLLKRAKNGFMNVFKSLFPKVMHLNVEYDEKNTQTLMTIRPNKFSVILSKLGDILNQEMAGIEKLEKYIQKNFIMNKWKAKINNTGVQTDYRTNADGVHSYEFKSYEQIENELESLRKINSVLIQEKALNNRNDEELDDFEKIMNRNKILESMIIKMRNFGQYKAEDLQLNEDENFLYNST